MLHKGTFLKEFLLKMLFWQREVRERLSSEPSCYRLQGSPKGLGKKGGGNQWT